MPSQPLRADTSGLTEFSASQNGRVTEADYVNRILDAAEACLMERPMSAPLHARIAERAGLSRPTVYKYVGDQDQIFKALVERGVRRYVEAVAPELSLQMPLRDHFAHLTAFSVGFFQSSPLMTAIMKHDGQRFLSWLAEEYQGVVRSAIAALLPELQEQLPSTRQLPVPFEEILEWGVRITIGLLIMPSASRDLASTEVIEDYVKGFIDSFQRR